MYYMVNVCKLISRYLGTNSHLITNSFSSLLVSLYVVQSSSTSDMKGTSCLDGPPLLNGFIFVDAIFFEYMMAFGSFWTQIICAHLQPKMAPM